MQEVVSIAPSLGEAGLIAAYECPNCVYVMGQLLQPSAQH
jgi:hypothetical protein